MNHGLPGRPVEFYLGQRMLDIVEPGCREGFAEQMALAMNGERRTSCQVKTLYGRTWDTQIEPDRKGVFVIARLQPPTIYEVLLVIHQNWAPRHLLDRPPAPWIVRRKAIEEHTQSAAEDFTARFNEAALGSGTWAVIAERPKTV